MKNYLSPTAETYVEGLQKAFDHFNAKLFENRLPPVLFTLTRKSRANGYFHAEQFQHRADGDATHEIALNPNTMDRDIRSILSTLVHEMTHLEQQEYGKPGKGAFHNKEWASLMVRIGLTPDNGQGGTTGNKVTHSIDEGGPFDVVFSELGPDFDIPYFTQQRPPVEKKRDISKVKTTCPCCNAKAWAKLGARLVCGDCNEAMLQEDEA